MTNVEIKNILVSKDIYHLYHTNTVLTSLTFINNGGLLSRGVVEDNNLEQSEQGSDAKDKKLGIYYDIFFDSVDIHSRSKDVNKYGPVTFEYSVNVIDELPEGVIKITRDNPIRWKRDWQEGKRYFDCLEDLNNGYIKGNYAQHFTIVQQMEPLDFKYLEKIIIDEPGIDNTKYFDNAVKTISEALIKNNINAPLIIRKCPLDCNCKSYYRSKKEGFTYYKFRTKNNNSLF